MPTIIKMPKWGLTMTQGTVVDWISSEGDEVSEGAPLLTVETEKAVDDVPAPADGILYKIAAAPGSEVPVSDPVGLILAPGETITEEEAAALLTPATSAAMAATDGGAAGARGQRERRAAARDSRGRVNASPAARKLAAELGVDLESVEATGPGGRITSDDVERAAAEGTPEPQERDLEISGGRHIHVLTAGPGRSQEIVFLHGLGGSISTWQIVLGDLAERYRVIAFDLPGHGASAKANPESADYSIDGHASAVAEALEAAKISSAILVGHSLGGAVALRVATQSSDLVSGLVLIDSALLGSDIAPELLDLMAGEPGKGTARGLLDLFMEDEKLVSQRAIDDMVGNQTGQGAWAAQQATANAAFAGGAQAGFDANVLQSIDKPALLIWGGKDRVIPSSHGHDALGYLPDATLTLLPDVGHVPQVERPEIVTRAIERFAKSLA
jgi:pimeloyl-ACP methyl ester carboxylesterase